MDDFNDLGNDLEAQFGTFESTPAKPVDLATKRQEKKNKDGGSQPKGGLPDDFETLMAWIAGKRSAQTLFGKPFPHKFAIRYLDDVGTKGTYLVRPGDVYVRFDPDAIASLVFQEIAKVVVEKGDAFRPYKFTPNRIRQFRDAWVYYSAVDSSEILDVRFKSDPGPCFMRLDFDPAPSPCPTWDHLMDTNIMSNAAALQAWIGALFRPQVLPQQWVWLYGDGQNGKSSIKRFIEGLLGDAATRLDTDPRTRDKFAAAILHEKRFAAADDCKNPGFVESEWLMTATGGGKITIDNKNQKAFATALNCMYFFTSNLKPQISADKSVQRRAIFVEFKRSNEVEWINDLEAMLHQEREGIIWKCLATFDELWKSCQIAVDKEANLAVSADVNDDFVELFNKHWECGDGEVSKRSIHYAGQEFFGNEWNHKLLGRFIRFIEGAYGVKPGWKRHGSSSDSAQRERIIRGMVRTSKSQF